MLELRIGSLSLTGKAPTEGPGELRIRPTIEPQVSKPIGAPGIKQFDRGNVAHTLTWAVTRGHASDDAAALFHVAHLQAVEAMGVSLLTYKTAAGTKYFLQAFAKVVDSWVEGSRTFHSYQVNAGEISDNPPG